MKKRILLNDIRSNKLATFSIFAFMAASAMLIALSVLLFGQLSGAIDSLMMKARTPDFLQMHSGNLDEKQVKSFAQGRDDVEDIQICRFLNLQNSEITLNGRSMTGNMQDNGLCVTNESFDLFLDSKDSLPEPMVGEVYVPICYKDEYDLSAGNVMKIRTYSLKIAGFFRDSQMNSMMASSKRFLVNEEDYEKIRSIGSEEYLIEFRLKPGSDVNLFASAYSDAGLPANGPTITYSLIKMMNALSDGLMILIILLASLAVLFISVICIRCLILTGLEKDKSEIGMMKAVGLSNKSISDIYFTKYLLLSGIGMVTGLVSAYILSFPLGEKIREYYGRPDKVGTIYAVMIFATVLAEVVILTFVRLTIRRLGRMSAVSIINGENTSKANRNLYCAFSVIMAAAMFMILVPINVTDTIASPAFASYMGIGDGSIRIDVRQTEDIRERSARLLDELKEDPQVTDMCFMRTSSYRAFLADGSEYDLMIENGDHSKFPVKYIEGTYPKGDSEIALSILNANEMGLKIGDEIRLEAGNIAEISADISRISLRVCGIYADITNGGKTAKSCLTDTRSPMMWSIAYLSLADRESEASWVNDFQNRHSSYEDGIKATRVEDYIKGTYGFTIANMKKASLLTSLSACLTLFIVVLLLLRLIVWKERENTSLKKALGYTTVDLKREYTGKLALYLLLGMAIGIFAGIVPGQSIAGIIMQSMGAYGFRFIIDPIKVFCFAPLMLAAVAIIAALIALREVKMISAFECLGGN